MQTANETEIETCTYADHEYQKCMLFRVILEHLPNNRRKGYYPKYYYDNPSLLCDAEMRTLDAPLYHQWYMSAINAQHQNNTRKGRCCVVQWCALCVFMRCIRPLLFPK